MPHGVAGLYGGGFSRRHIVVGLVARHARYAAVGVLRGPPTRALGTLVLLVTPQADFRNRGRVLRLNEAENKALAGVHVFARGAVARFAAVRTMHVLGKGPQPHGRLHLAQCRRLDLLSAGD